MVSHAVPKESPGTHLSVTQKKSRDWLPVIFLGPAGLILAIFILVPLLRSFFLSLFNANLLRPDQRDFVGLGNYIDLLSGGRFWNSLWVTVAYTVSVVVLAYAIGMVTAFLLNRNFRFRWLARTIIIVPWAIPEVVAVMIFRWMLDAQFGIINHLLLSVGIVNEPIAWLSDPSLALVVVIATTTWIAYPLATLILLAGLQTIPEEMMEAAQLDGANWVKRFRFITIPMLRFVNIVVIMLLTLDTFRRTTLIYTMTGGGPRRATETLPVWTYVEAFNNHQLGSASAIGVLVLLILGLATIGYFVTVVRKAN